MDEDAYSSYNKQFRLLGLVISYDELCRDALNRGADMDALFAITAREKIARAKIIADDLVNEEFAKIEAEMKQQINDAVNGGELI